MYLKYLKSGYIIYCNVDQSTAFFIGCYKINPDQYYSMNVGIMKYGL